ncbi:hypothetical protein BACI9J_90088 [Bacillus altitudinis]|jgi:hypothetical protein|nr:hypothetical protein BACI9J_90088 [Bacillus altitudinis]
MDSEKTRKTWCIAPGFLFVPKKDITSKTKTFWYMIGIYDFQDESRELFLIWK